MVVWVSMVRWVEDFGEIGEKLVRWMEEFGGEEYLVEWLRTFG